MTDVGEICEACGYVSHLGAVVQHHLIPESVAKQAGMAESATVNLCSNCHLELDNWYKTKVTDIVYDPKTQRFRAKTWDEKVKEYESAFRAFKNYKDEQRGIR